MYITQNTQNTGLFKSLYGTPQVGLFTSAFSNAGAASVSKNSDVRLGDDTTPPFYTQAIVGVPMWVWGLVAVGYLLGKR